MILCYYYIASSGKKKKTADAASGAKSVEEEITVDSFTLRNIYNTIEPHMCIIILI